MKKNDLLRNSFVIGIILESILLVIMEVLNLFLLGLVCSALLFSFIISIGVCLEYKKK